MEHIDTDTPRRAVSQTIGVLAELERSLNNRTEPRRCERRKKKSVKIRT
jgi:hypothetical protein